MSAVEEADGLERGQRSLGALVVVAGVLTAFASFFIYLIRRAKMVQESPAEAGHDIRGQEGTAQC